MGQLCELGLHYLPLSVFISVTSDVHLHVSTLHVQQTKLVSFSHVSEKETFIKN